MMRLPRRWMGIGFLISASMLAATADEPMDLCRLQLVGAEALSIDDVAKAAVAFIKKNSVLPSEAELAAQAKVSPEVLRDFFDRAGNPTGPAELIERTKEGFPAVFEALQKKTFSRWGAFFKQYLRPPSIEELAIAMGVKRGNFELLYGTPDSIAEHALVAQRGLLEVARKHVARVYAAGAQQRRATLTLEELAADLKSTPEIAGTWFGAQQGALFCDLRALKDFAVQLTPNSFKYVEDRELFTPERKQKARDAYLNHRRAIFTTVGAGVALHEEALEALMKMAKEIDAEIFLLPANMEVFYLDPRVHELEGVHIVTNDWELAPETKISTTEITMKMIRPITGLMHRGKRGQLQIYASPKQWVETAATLGENDYPHMVVTTGAITAGSYRGGTAMSQRTNKFGEEDHVIGAVVLEKSTGQNRILPGSGHGYFHFRHIEYRKSEDGVWGFSDLGKVYTSEGAKKATGHVLTLEAHVGDTDQQILETLRSAFKKISPTTVVIHDIFNGHSINHHEWDRAVTRGRAADAGRLDLYREVRQVVAFLDTILSFGPNFEVRIDLSNHDLWLNTYLQSHDWKHDSPNYVFASELNYVFSQGKNPLEYAIQKIATESYGRRDIFRRVRFMKPSEELKGGDSDEDPVEIGQHGDVGANGAKGSINSAKVATRRGVSGHTHTYRRQNGNLQFGTLTKRRLDYNRHGASNWVQGIGVVAPDGAVQVLVFADGEWFAEDKAPTPPPEEFFFEGFPREIERPPFAGYGNSLDATSAFRMYTR